VDKVLLKKYIKGECNPVEAEKVIKWINSPQFDQDLLLLIEEDLDQYDLYSTYSSKNTKRRALQDIYSKAYSERNKVSVKFKSYAYSNIFFKIAASITLLFIAFYFFVYENEDATPTVAEVSEEIIKQNDRGRKSTIFLPDGSVVYLNSESFVKYDEVSFDSIRTIHLVGEAFFEISRDTIHPFKVVSKNVEVTALGTSFNVKSFEDDSETSISLITGKVLVKSNSDSASQLNELFLNPGQEVSYWNKRNSFSAITPFDPRATYGWKDGILYFKESSLTHVLAKLERWFDVDFEVMNESPDRKSVV